MAVVEAEEEKAYFIEHVADDDGGGSGGHNGAGAFTQVRVIVVLSVRQRETYCENGRSSIAW